MVHQRSMAALIMALSVKLGVRFVCGRRWPVMGEDTPPPRIQRSMWDRSYVKPSAATTGSTIISRLSGQQNSSGYSF